jgi:hypothetical protein
MPTHERDKEHLPYPPFYADGNAIGAVTWFRDPMSDEMSNRIGRLRTILSRHGVDHDLARSADPGDLVYEDRSRSVLCRTCVTRRRPGPTGSRLADMHGHGPIRERRVCDADGHRPEPGLRCLAWLSQVSNIRSLAGPVQVLVCSLGV